ncbi:MAG: response regulator transcription factor [Bacilli bacterium]|nr:response regulator transcription factor [Bacilli bacterium]
MIKIALLDDDKTALTISKGVIEQFFQEKNIPFSVDAFTASQAFVAMAKEEKYQLVFLDIDVDEMNGIDAGKIVKDIDPQTDIVYLSQREDLVFDTLFLHPFGFIRKSKILQDFPSVLQLYLDTHIKEEDTSKLVVTSKNGMINIVINDIMYIEGNKNYQTIYLKDSTSHEVRLSMGDLEKQLENKGFIRIHKGYLVNYVFIRKIVKNDVLLTNNKILPLAGKRREEIMEKYLAVSRANKSIFM